MCKHLPIYGVVLSFFFFITLLITALLFSLLVYAGNALIQLHNHLG
jgi:hypothetical protein